MTRETQSTSHGAWHAACGLGTHKKVGIPQTPVTTTTGCHLEPLPRDGAKAYSKQRQSIFKAGQQASSTGSEVKDYPSLHDTRTTWPGVGVLDNDSELRSKHVDNDWATLWLAACDVGSNKKSGKKILTGIALPPAEAPGQARWNQNTSR